jgi:type III secretion system low calcium response chaperone LcrH/SycD
MAIQPQVQQALENARQQFLHRWLDETLTQRKPSGMESEEQYKARMEAQFQQMWDEQQRAYGHAIDLLADAQVWPLERSQERAAELAQKAQSLSQMSDEEARKQTAQQLLRLTNEQMEQFYQVAKRWFEQGNFQNAVDLFTLLTSFNPWVPAFWVGLGLSYEKLKVWDKAAVSHVAALQANPDELTPILQAAYCLHQAGRGADARKLLEKALEETKEHPQQATFRQQADRWLAVLPR